jgi:hypothetical protein
MLTWDGACEPHKAHSHMCNGPKGREPGTGKRGSNIVNVPRHTYQFLQTLKQHSENSPQTQGNESMVGVPWASFSCFAKTDHFPFLRQQAQQAEQRCTCELASVC